MAIVPVNTSNGGDYTGTLSATIPAAAQSLSAGNLIVVGIRAYDPTNVISVGSVTDTAGNTYFKATGKRGTSTNCRLEIWYAYNTIANASNVVTANITGGNAQYYGIVTSQYSGLLATGSPADANGTGDAISTTTVATGAMTTVQANELLVAIAEYDAAVGAVWTAGTGFAIRVQDTSSVCMMQDQIVSAVQTGITIGATLNTARNLQCCAATFKMSGKPAYPENFKFIRVGDGMSTGERIR